VRRYGVSIAIALLAGSFAPASVAAAAGARGAPSGASREARRPAAYERGAPPPWVIRHEADPTYSPAPSAVSGGVALALLETQRRVSPRDETYVHSARKIVSASGVERVSEVSINFDPSYQRVVMHGLRIQRGAETIDALEHASVRVLDQEPDWNDGILHGKRTLLFVLRDVRVSDLIDIEYTIVGRNPAFGDDFAAVFPLAGAAPARRVFARLVVPKGRAVVTRGHAGAPEAVSRDEGAEHSLTWELENVHPAPVEPSTPRWFERDPWVEATSFASFQEVARWGASLYRVDAAEAARVRPRALAVATGESLEERARAIVRFVQNEVRYLGEEEAEHSHRPHAPSEVLARRFGDCKDKALLLVTLLAAIGVEAQPALVDSDSRAHVGDRLPSPYAFDHVIVRMSLDGNVVWVDATRRDQGGTLFSQDPPAFGRALVIDEATIDLETIPRAAPRAPTFFVRERFAPASGRDDRLQFEVETEASGDEADRMRAMLATRAHDELARGWLDHYARRYASVEPLAAFDVADDRIKNVIVVREHYTIAKPGPGGALRVEPTPVSGHLSAPTAARRTTPYGIAHPVFVRYEARLELEEAHEVTSDTREEGDAAFRFRAERRAPSPNVLEVAFEYRSSADTVPPERFAAYAEALERADALAGYNYVFPYADEVPNAVLANLGIGLAGLVGVVSLVVVGVNAPRMFRRERFQRKARMGVGDAATMPRAVRDDDAAEADLAKAKCVCGKKLGAAAREAERGRVRIGSSEVESRRARCTGCGAVRARYYVIG
jgi:transglutaminase-like putative cysteine protease